MITNLPHCVFKVIDFGTSCYEGSSQSVAADYVQTRYYRAPEVHNLDMFDKIFDYWKQTINHSVLNQIIVSWN